MSGKEWCEIEAVLLFFGRRCMCKKQDGDHLQKQAAGIPRCHSFFSFLSDRISDSFLDVAYAAFGIPVT